MIDILEVSENRVVVSTGRVRVTLWQDAEGKLHRSRALVESRASGKDADYLSPQELDKASRMAIAILARQKQKKRREESQLEIPF